MHGRRWSLVPSVVHVALVVPIADRHRITLLYQAISTCTMTTQTKLHILVCSVRSCRVQRTSAMSRRVHTIRDAPCWRHPTTCPFGGNSSQSPHLYDRRRMCTTRVACAFFLVHVSPLVLCFFSLLCSCVPYRRQQQFSLSLHRQY